MTWGFIWLMLALKIPLICLCWLVWWAIKQEPDPLADPSHDDGGTKLRPQPRHPRPPRRPPSRRGPHGDPALHPPPRVRTTIARSVHHGR